MLVYPTGASLFSVSLMPAGASEVGRAAIVSRLFLGCFARACRDITQPPEQHQPQSPLAPPQVLFSLSDIQFDGATCNRTL